MRKWSAVLMIDSVLRVDGVSMLQPCLIGNNIFLQCNLVSFEGLLCHFTFTKTNMSIVMVNYKEKESEQVYIHTYILIAQLVRNSPDAGDASSIPGLGRSPGEGIGYRLQYSWASLVAQVVKNLAAIQETWVQFLDQEDPLQKGNGYPFQHFYLENPMDREAWQAMIQGISKIWTPLSE